VQEWSSKIAERAEAGTVRAAASNSLGLFAEDIVENFLKDLDNEGTGRIEQEQRVERANQSFRQLDNSTFSGQKV
jgi:hypothetical protein